VEQSVTSSFSVGCKVGLRYDIRGVKVNVRGHRIVVFRGKRGRRGGLIVRY
jgi:hypothetical protein